MPPGVPAIGRMALVSRAGGRPALQFRTTLPASTGEVQLWRDLVGSTFLYTAANWGAVAWSLEVVVRPTSGKALARLYDVTAAAAVSGSTITLDAASGVLLVPTRARSSALALVDGHEYRVQYGVQDGGAGAAVSAKLIAV